MREGTVAVGSNGTTGATVPVAVSYDTGTSGFGSLPFYCMICSFHHNFWTNWARRSRLVRFWIIYKTCSTGTQFVLKEVMMETNITMIAYMCGFFFNTVLYIVYLEIMFASHPYFYRQVNAKSVWQYILLHSVEKPHAVKKVRLVTNRGAGVVFIQIQNWFCQKEQQTNVIPLTTTTTTTNNDNNIVTNYWMRIYRFLMNQFMTMSLAEGSHRHHHCHKK